MTKKNVCNIFLHWLWWWSQREYAGRGPHFKDPQIDARTSLVAVFLRSIETGLTSLSSGCAEDVLLKERGILSKG